MKLKKNKIGPIRTHLENFSHCDAVESAAGVLLKVFRFENSKKIKFWKFRNVEGCHVINVIRVHMLYEYPS